MRIINRIRYEIIGDVCPVCGYKLNKLIWHGYHDGNYYTTCKCGTFLTSEKIPKRFEVGRNE